MNSCTSYWGVLHHVMYTNEQNRARIYLTVRRICPRVLQSDGPYDRLICTYCLMRPRRIGFFIHFVQHVFIPISSCLFFDIVVRVVVELEMSKNVVIVSHCIGLA